MTPDTTSEGRMTREAEALRKTIDDNLNAATNPSEAPEAIARAIAEQLGINKTAVLALDYAADEMAERDGNMPENYRTHHVARALSTLLELANQGDV